LTNQSFKGFVEKLEPWLTGILLLYFLGLDAPYPIVKLMKVASYGIIIFLILPHWKRFAYVATRDIPLLLLVTMAILSVLWSTSPEVTSIETKAILRANLFGVYLATRYSIKEQMQLLAWVLGIGAVLSFVLAIGIPSYGIHLDGEAAGAWKGIYGFKNLFAANMTVTAVLFLITAFNTRRKRWLSWIMFGLAAVLLFLSKGKTAYSVFFISLCLLPLHKFVKQQYKLRVVLLLTTLLLSGSVIVLMLSNLEFIVVDTLGKNLEFNGRLPIWTLILDKVVERPWLGYGMSGFWTSDEALYVLYNSWGAVALEEGVRFNAHNGYLDLLLSLGVLGVLLYLLILLRLLTRAVYLWLSTKNIEFLWIIQYIIIISLLNFADNLAILGGTLWSIYVSLILSTTIQKTRIIKAFQQSKGLGSIQKYS